MKVKRHLFLTLNVFLLAVFVYMLVPTVANAAACPGVWSEPPVLSAYLDCSIPRLFSGVRMLLVATSIVITMLLIFKTVTNYSNSNVLEELPSRWKYLIILVILTFAGGTIVNMVLKLLGVGDVRNWLDWINYLLDQL